MSSRKSDISADLSVRPGIESLKANFAIPILILLMIPLQKLVEGPAVGPYHQRIIMLVGFNIILAVSLQLINGFSGQFALGHAGFMAVGAYLAGYPAMNFSQKMTDPFACLIFFIGLGTGAAIAAIFLFGLFFVIRASKSIHRNLPSFLLIGLGIWLLLDFSQATAMANGGYPLRFVWSNGIVLLQRLFSWITSAGLTPAAKMSAFLPSGLAGALSYLVLIVGGGVCASVVGLIVGMPALRLRGDYLAIATLGMAEIIRIIIQNSQPLGGALGLVGIPKYTNFAWLYGAVIVTTAVIWRIGYSAKGRAIMAVREDEIAAAAIGVDPTHHKVMTFVIGAFFGGVAGAMFSLHERSITPGYFNMAKSIEIVVMVTLGGLGSISGAILAAAVLTLLPEVLRNVGAEISDYRMIIYSTLLVLMMLLRPQGLLGGRELWPGRRGAIRQPVATEDRDDNGVEEPAGV